MVPAMLWELIALGVAVVAALLAAAALLVAHRHPFRQAVRRQNEALEDMARGIERWKGSYDEELEKAKKRYREAARVYRELVDAQPIGDEGGPGDEEAPDVHGRDAEGGDRRGVPGLPPALVAAGIWPGGRAG